ncbi:hypothetical protein An02g02550 [Aspergillus niger]|uniref:Uncharacterized protein n=2 Tax=Aspergillus niger TaxID=5061 RepID=A2QC76_ASPNC|nr:hypothetical protein An02g02550 [Aspergillus niger]CAK37536.1 hypothetical protein An02g02550 [Aspergillus niger]
MGKLSCRAIWAFSCLPTAGKRDIQEAESRSRTVQIASEPSLADPGTQGGPRLSGVEEPKGRLNRLRGVSPAKRDGAPCKAPVCGDAIQNASMDRPTRFGEEGVGQRDLASAGDSIPRLDWDAECYLTILLGDSRPVQSGLKGHGEWMLFSQLDERLQCLAQLRGKGTGMYSVPVGRATGPPRYQPVTSEADVAGDKTKLEWFQFGTRTVSGLALGLTASPICGSREFRR